MYRSRLLLFVEDDALSHMKAWNPILFEKRNKEKLEDLPVSENKFQTELLELWEENKCKGRNPSGLYAILEPNKIIFNTLVSSMDIGYEMHKAGINIRHLGK